MDDDNPIWKCSVEYFKLPFIIIKNNYACIPINAHHDLLNRLERENIKFKENMIFSDNEFSIYVPNVAKIIKSIR